MAVGDQPVGTGIMSVGCHPPGTGIHPFGTGMVVGDHPVGTGISRVGCHPPGTGIHPPGTGMVCGAYTSAAPATPAINKDPTTAPTAASRINFDIIKRICFLPPIPLLRSTVRNPAYISTLPPTVIFVNKMYGHIKKMRPEANLGLLCMRR